ISTLSLHDALPILEDSKGTASLLGTFFHLRVLFSERNSCIHIVALTGKKNGCFQSKTGAGSGDEDRLKHSKSGSLANQLPLEKQRIGGRAVFSQPRAKGQPAGGAPARNACYRKIATCAKTSLETTEPRSMARQRLSVESRRPA